jgi:hypothetical protein
MSSPFYRTNTVLEVEAPYDQVLFALGQPGPGTDDGKTRAQWTVPSLEGEVHVYDWKKTAPIEDVYFWNINAPTQESAEFVAARIHRAGEWYCRSDLNHGARRHGLVCREPLQVENLLARGHDIQWTCGCGKEWVTEVTGERLRYPRPGDEGRSDHEGDN